MGNLRRIGRIDGIRRIGYRARDFAAKSVAENDQLSQREHH